MAELYRIVDKIIYDLLDFLLVSLYIFHISCKCKTELDILFLACAFKRFYRVLYDRVHIKCTYIKADTLWVKLIKSKYIACELGKPVSFKKYNVDILINHFRRNSSVLNSLKIALDRGQW